MSGTSTSADVDENTIEDDAIVQSEGIEHDDYDTFSATSTACTSCSYISYNVKINNTQLYIQPVHGHTIECLDHITGSNNANIGSISVQNASDVTFGNKTFFNAPVVIKQLVVDYGDYGDRRSSDSTPRSRTQPKQPWSSRILNSFQNHPIMVCSIFTTLAMIVATLILVGYFLDPFDIPATCEEIESTPSYYTCGSASACTRCKMMFPDREICQSYYEPQCGDVRCFCKPQCRSMDCR